MQKARWSRVYESSEEELVQMLQDLKLQTERLVVHADDDPIERTTDSDQRIWCGEGSLSMRDGSASLSIQTGDMVRVPAGTSYILQPGISGFICYLTN